MTAKLGSAATAKITARLTASSGINATLANLTADGSATAAFDTSQVLSRNAAADLTERAGSVQYPALTTYCEKIANTMTEKFRSFSGTVQMAVELRHSQDRLEGLEDAVELYADAVVQVLNASKGDWGDGMYYAGGYQVAYGAVKHGGKNFMQTAKITFEIGASRS